ncbi:UNVERIFIED_CONTAM: polyprotein [Sesamum radiatum]|uniref:Polyprotein n=1 Tax=Sesamum radiatum TaxID=300843 RepID=A0AAW2ILN0_SESRA
MTPDDLALAREECSQLLALGLIEPTKSNWACPAFYVNKRTEQIRGKKRLVIDYKALNHFYSMINSLFLRPRTSSLSALGIQLSKLLKKEPPPWGQAQTMALQKLKQVCQQPLPLKIPSTGHRILQTDASNEFWGAILIEEENGKKHFCGHASGQKRLRKTLPCSLQRILAIKYGIKNSSSISLDIIHHIDGQHLIPEDYGSKEQGSSRATTAQTKRLVFQIPVHSETY